MLSQTAPNLGAGTIIAFAGDNRNFIKHRLSLNSGNRWSKANSM